MKYFGRKYKLTLGGIATPPITDLRVEFKILRSLKPEANPAVITIYNLAESTRSLLSNAVAGVDVMLEAGYEDNINLIFKGHLRRVFQQQAKGSVGWMTTLRAGDGEKAMATARLNKSFKPGVTPKDIIDSLSKELGVNLGNALKKAAAGDKKGALTTYNRGYVAKGNAYDRVVQIFGDLGYTVSVQNNELQVLAADEVLEVPAEVISPGTGLVGSVERGEKGAVNAVSLLNGRLVPGARCVIDCESVKKGVFRIERVEHIGDSHGTEWVSKLGVRKFPT